MQRCALTLLMIRMFRANEAGDLGRVQIDVVKIIMRMLLISSGPVLLNGRLFCCSCLRKRALTVLQS